MRAAINWSQGQLAQKAGLTQPTISAFEKGETESPGIKAVNAIIAACRSEGFYFTDNGIEKKEANTFTIEGDDCYLRLLKIAEAELQDGDLFLKSNADERKSSAETISQLQKMRDKGIVFRSLVRSGDTHIMGAPSEYRWMDDALHQKGDVKIVFGDCVAYLVSWTSPAKVIVVQDEIISAEARRTFEFIWKQSQQPNMSTAAIRFSGVANG